MNKISVCTASTPWYALPELVPLVSAAGFDGLEIGVKPHTANRAEPPDFWRNNSAIVSVDALAVMAPGLRELLRAHRLRLSAISSYHEAQDLDVHRRLARIARDFDCPVVRATMPAHDPALGYRAQLGAQRMAWRELALVGVDEGVRFCIELHDHSLTPSASAAMRVLEGLPMEGVGVICDIANTVFEGNEAIPMLLDVLGPALAHVHVKQRRMCRRDEVYRCSMLDMPISPLTEPGDIAWPEIISMLRATGYHGWFSIENFTHIDRREERLQTDVAWLRSLCAAQTLV